MSRNGKIAKLPHRIREELNLRLQDNEEGQPLLDWLNAQPETREVLQKSFNGVPISKQNLSEWRQGGFREWVIRTDLSSHVSLLSENSHSIEMEVDAPVLAGKLATVLAAQYAKLLVDWDGEPDEKIEAKLRVMRIFCRDIALLQRTMHRATNQKNEFYQKADDDEKKEIKAMKDKAVAPLMALVQEEFYACGTPKDSALRQIAAIIAAVDYDQPIPQFDDNPSKSQTASHPVKPSQTNKPSVKPAKPAETSSPSGGANSTASGASLVYSDSCEPTDPIPHPVKMKKKAKFQTEPQELPKSPSSAEESPHDQ